MTLLLSVLGVLALAIGLAGAGLFRALRRHDHRCREQSRPWSCERCAAVLAGLDRGGHLVCACGAVSPHLEGADLLAWGAAHHGEEFPALPRDARTDPVAGDPAGAAAGANTPTDNGAGADSGAGSGTGTPVGTGADSTTGADAEPSAEPEPEPEPEAPVRYTTRVRAAAEAEEHARRALAEELSETERRKIVRARRKPDPITPQLLREAEKLGIRPQQSGPNEPGTPEERPAAPVNAEPDAEPAPPDPAP